LQGDREIWATGSSKKFESFAKLGIRKLAMLNAAATLRDLKVPRGNHLQTLKGARAGQHSIRSNKQFLLCFIFKEGNAYEVEIIDL
jgi:toxin HigB-1